MKPTLTWKGDLCANAPDGWAVETVALADGGYGGMAYLIGSHVGEHHTGSHPDARLSRPTHAIRCAPATRKRQEHRNPCVNHRLVAARPSRFAVLRPVGAEHAIGIRRPSALHPIPREGVHAGRAVADV